MQTGYDAPRATTVTRQPASRGTGTAHKPKVAFIINSLAGGGAERVMITLLSHSEARKDRYDICLILLDDLAKEFQPPDWLETVQLPGSGGMLESGIGLRQALKKLDPDITISFLTRANIWNALLARWRSRPAIISERVNTSAHLPASLSGQLARLMVRLSYPRAAGVIAVSHGVAEDLVQHFGVRRSRAHVVYNPFDFSRVRMLSLEAPSWHPPIRYGVALGRLVENKNFEGLLEAYAAAKIEQSLVILGEGPGRERLRQLARELGIAERVFMPGFQSNPYPLLKRAEFYVSSSRAEGFPNALVEAMALGLPVLSTDCPSGPSEILCGHASHHLALTEYGILVPCNDVAELSSGLQLISQKPLQRQLSARSLERAEAFQAQAAVDAYWCLIDRHLGTLSDS